MMVDQQNIDHVRFAMNKVMDLIDETVIKIEKLDDDLKNELSTASNDPMSGLTQNDYYEWNRYTREKLITQRENLNVEYETLRDELMVHFQSQKKYEALERLKVDEDQQKILKDEMSAMDEIATTRFHRNGKN